MRPKSERTSLIFKKLARFVRSVRSVRFMCVMFIPWSRPNREAPISSSFFMFEPRHDQLGLEAFIQGYPFRLSGSWEGKE